MMRRSGVRPALAASKVARDTPRRAACGHWPAMQVEKLAAAARIASALMSGWPEVPASPLHSRALAGAAMLAAAGAVGADRARASSVCAWLPETAIARSLRPRHEG